jgi:hypothetical protein
MLGEGADAQRLALRIFDRAGIDMCPTCPAENLTVVAAFDRLHITQQHGTLPARIRKGAGRQKDLLALFRPLVDGAATGSVVAVSFFTLPSDHLQR